MTTLERDLVYLMMTISKDASVHGENWWHRYWVREQPDRLRQPHSAEDVLRHAVHDGHSVARVMVV